MTQVSATKTWKLNGQNVDNLEPNAISSVKVKLYQVGERVTAMPGPSSEQDYYVIERKLKGNSETEYEWTLVTAKNLPKYYVNGDQLVQYKYYFEELPENEQNWDNQELPGDWIVHYSSQGNEESPIATSAAVEGEGEFKIENSKYTLALPSTGGEGTNGFMKLGLSLMITAICAFGLKMLLFKRREEE